MHSEETNEVVVQPPDKEKIRKIWKVALILGIVTACEFAVAFLLPPEYRTIKIVTFIIMTIVKAFYIVGEFMHLGHEVKSLIYSVLIPMAFVVWLLIALIVEGDSILMAR
ncbi:cytochrome C oxidase subunit IV family protein [Fulvivirgaceae bacterium BMA12]|uniref:Cytochrome C oxidase subunit IV family protein n=1 Tax=Agaribacillus aureus TaxID=3051825 RepID=A0ABT8L062_9BACT|nr:cytochrome C oxidase subunit IV family protein [Fulvivirgaceae bacterium BMA12]